MVKTIHIIKEIGKEKISRLPIKIIAKDKIKKPSWIKMQLPNSEKFHEVKRLLKETGASTFEFVLQAALIWENAGEKAQRHL